MTFIEAQQRRAIQRRPGRPRDAATNGRRALAPSRPPATTVVHRGTGVAMSRAPHRRRPVSAAVTVAVAAMAAAITLLLGEISLARTPSPVPESLTVVRVQPGENLQHLAARVAPAAPIGPVAERIMELNDLDSVTLDAGQTLVVPAR